MPERLDTSEMPLTEPHAAPIFDTGPHPAPIASSVDVLDVDSQAFSHELESELGADSAFEWPDLDSGPQAVPAAPAEARSEYQYVQWWKFLLLTLGVWTDRGRHRARSLLLVVPLDRQDMDRFHGAALRRCVHRRRAARLDGRAPTACRDDGCRADVVTVRVR